MSGVANKHSGLQRVWPEPFLQSIPVASDIHRLSGVAVYYELAKLPSVDVILSVFRCTV